jgi:hypothetical protein|tara:strand:- start:2711 stop:3568 length:858 start_codon:yes stop_codon:yes gene_type:complete
MGKTLPLWDMVFPFLFKEKTMETFAQELMSQLKTGTKKSSSFSNIINDSIEEIALTDIDLAIKELDDLSDEDYAKATDSRFMEGLDNIEVSNFVNIDQLGELDEDEIVGMSYWTERRINQFIYGYMKFQFKKLFDAHSSVDTVKDVLNWIFKYPIFKKEENIRIFSFQHIAISLNVCPLQLMQDLQTKITRAGIYDRLDTKSSIVRTRRSVGLTFVPSSKQKQSILKALVKRFEEGKLPNIISHEQLIRLVDKQFKQREQQLLNTDDLFSKDNIRNTQRRNGENW